ncbi:hypothetical protein RCOM_0550780 [Ricinus communis]|uniref:Uncharacterized protein n=1 Tax=Ricinus communis TaxID=3988 RepID=B9T4U2_RICCO|nr:hypothetical protein RCOM_0550780 [Ricinus communis]
MASFHIRSINLPSRSHPLTVSIEEQLYKLRTSQFSSTAPSHLMRKYVQGLESSLRRKRDGESCLNEVSYEEEIEANEVEKIDAELFVLKLSKDVNQVKNVLKGLEALELSLQEVEEELECAYTRLVKTRVSLLNILNN